LSTILQRIAAGDESAVADCVDEYGPLAWRLAWRYLGRVSGDIEDAVQEVFVEIWMAAQRFDPGVGSEASFVATIIHRRLIDYQRRMTTRSREITDPQPLAERAPARVQDLVAGRAFGPVAEAFDRLPDAEREALWLSVHGGLSHAQIAAATDSPIGTVKSRLRRGLIRLYEALRPTPASAAPEGEVT